MDKQVEKLTEDGVCVRIAKRLTVVDVPVSEIETVREMIKRHPEYNSKYEYVGVCHISPQPCGIDKTIPYEKLRGTLNEKE